MEGRRARRRMVVLRIYPGGPSVLRDPLMADSLLVVSIIHHWDFGDHAFA